MRSDDSNHDYMGIAQASKAAMSSKQSKQSRGRVSVEEDHELDDARAKKSRLSRGEAEVVSPGQSSKDGLKQYAAVNLAETVLAECEVIITQAQDTATMHHVTERIVETSLSKLKRRLAPKEIALYAAESPGFSLTVSSGETLEAESLTGMGLRCIDNMNKMKAKLEALLNVVQCLTPANAKKAELGTAQALALALHDANLAGLALHSDLKETVVLRATKAAFLDRDFGQFAALLDATAKEEGAYGLWTLPAEARAEFQKKALLNRLLEIFRSDQQPDRLAPFLNVVLSITIMDTALCTELHKLRTVLQADSGVTVTLEELLSARRFFDVSETLLFKCLSVLPLGIRLMASLAKCILAHESDDRVRKDLKDLKRKFPAVSAQQQAARAEGQTPSPSATALSDMVFKVATIRAQLFRATNSAKAP